MTWFDWGLIVCVGVCGGMLAHTFVDRVNRSQRKRLAPDPLENPRLYEER